MGGAKAQLRVGGAKAQLGVGGAKAQLGVMKVVWHAGADSRTILFGPSNTPTNDLSLQSVTSMQGFPNHGLRQTYSTVGCVHHANHRCCPFSLSPLQGSGFGSPQCGPPPPAGPHPGRGPTAQGLPQPVSQGIKAGPHPLGADPPPRSDADGREETEGGSAAGQLCSGPLAQAVWVRVWACPECSHGHQWSSVP